MSNQRTHKLAILLVVVALLGLACGACDQTPRPRDTAAEQPTASPPEPTAEEATAEPPTEEATAEPPTQEASAEPPTEEATAETPTEEPPTSEPTAAELVPCPEVKCLPDCYANNLAPAGGDGTKSNPWRGTAEDSQLFDDVACAAKEQGMIPSALTILTCSANSQTCTGVLFTYDGRWAREQLTEAPPNPYVGVDLPFVFVLVGVTVLGVALLGAGIFLRLRARTLRT